MDARRKVRGVSQRRQRLYAVARCHDHRAVFAAELAGHNYYVLSTGDEASKAASVESGLSNLWQAATLERLYHSLHWQMARFHSRARHQYSARLRVRLLPDLLRSGRLQPSRDVWAGTGFSQRRVFRLPSSNLAN